jgi:AcrR family transcriptional regulator
MLITLGHGLHGGVRMFQSAVGNSDTSSRLLNLDTLSNLFASPTVRGVPDSPPASARARQRRSDARRSVEAILDAGLQVLTGSPDASMDDIARTAGVSRQTVYAHFASRDALLRALVERAAVEYDQLLDSAGLYHLDPDEALGAFLDVGWQFLERFPLLLGAGAARLPRPTPDPHDEVLRRLVRILRRGRRQGVFQASMPVDWLACGVLALHHAAASQLGAGQLRPKQARMLCLESARRLCGAPTADLA